MRFEEQGTIDNTRYTIVPRTLNFVTIDDQLLLLRGAPDKRIWPNRLNGLGGHIEPHETPEEGARREIREEAGLAVASLRLGAIIHVAGRQPDPGVILMVYVAQAICRTTIASSEGTLDWYPLDDLPYGEMVQDLPRLLPLLFDAERTHRFVYGHYTTTTDGEMRFRFDCV